MKNLYIEKIRLLEILAEIRKGQVEHGKHYLGLSISEREALKVIASLTEQIKAQQSNTTSEIKEGCKCQNCGNYFKMDLNIPDEIWGKITLSNNKEGGLLCPICIVKKIEEIFGYSAFCLNPSVPSDEDIEAWARTKYPDHYPNPTNELEMKVMTMQRNFQNLLIQGAEAMRDGKITPKAE